ncbi:MAG TPA: transglutaminase-like domain-containing protein [Armatimonadota bacterium]|nr:transglutaminase-like domain-containing protein [Armatimonadota bacterium]
MEMRFALFGLLALATGCGHGPSQPWFGGYAGAHRAAPKVTGFDIDNYLGAEWYGVYVNGSKLGYSVSFREKTTHNGKPAYRFGSELALALPLFRSSCYSTYLATGELVAIHSINEEGGRGSIYCGMVTDDTMTVTSSANDVQRTQAVPAPAVTLEDEIASLRLILSDPQPGASVTIKSYSLEECDTRISILTIKDKRTLLLDGSEMIVYDAKQVSQVDGGLTSVLFDRRGKALRIGFSGKRMWELRLEPEETAKNLKTAELAGYIVRPKGKMPSPTAERLRLKITGLEEEQIVADSRQQFEKMDDGAWLVTLTRDSWPAQPPALPIADPELAEFLKPTARYQSDAPVLKAKATHIVTENSDAAQVAQAICAWVYANLRIGKDVDDALGALRVGAALCKGNTALFVALCRATGLPARGVVGLAYAPTFEGFGAHAWAEVYVGRWIAADPAWGQPLASAARIKFGDEEARIRHMDRLSIEAFEDEDQQAE